MSQSYGSLTESCLYTASARLKNTLQTTTVTIRSQADPCITYSFPLYVFPSDAIRMHLGLKSTTPGPRPSHTLALLDYGPEFMVITGGAKWR